MRICEIEWVKWSKKDYKESFYDSFSGNFSEGFFNFILQNRSIKNLKYNSFIEESKPNLFINSYQKNIDVLKHLSNEFDNLYKKQKYFITVVNSFLTKLSELISEDCSKTSCLVDASHEQIETKKDFNFSSEEDLLNSNNHILLSNLDNLYKNDKVFLPAPLAVEIDSRYHLIDGNHRFVVARALKKINQN